MTGPNRSTRDGGGRPVNNVKRIILGRGEFIRLFRPIRRVYITWFDRRVVEPSLIL